MQKYIGNYAVHETVTCYGFIDPCFHERDTVIYVGQGSTDTTLMVLGREVYLDENGFYAAYHYGLRLWNDSISSSYMSGGLGGGTYINHQGFKVN